MKYLNLAALGPVTNALNFSTSDCHIIGGCDIYTIKSTGPDKKLHKDIEKSLDWQYQTLVRLADDMGSPNFSASHASINRAFWENPHNPKIAVPAFDHKRRFPFGSISEPAARRTYAYLILTLNAAHPDYDFSNILRPWDFKEERSLRSVMYHVDSTLRNLRPHKHLSPPTAFLAPLTSSPPRINGAGGEVWGPQMWSLINSAMDLKSCEKYSYSPEDDPFEGDDGGIWTMHYFFFNKKLKRVCYLYLRALSVISHSPMQIPILDRPSATAKSHALVAGERSIDKKRRDSSLAGRHDSAVERPIFDLDAVEEDDDDLDDAMVIAEPGDDELDVPNMSLDEIRWDLAEGHQHFSYDESYYHDDSYDDEEPDESAMSIDGTRYSTGSPIGKEASFVRGVSEEIAAGMEM